MKKLICFLFILSSLCSIAFGEPLLNYDNYSSAELRQIVEEAMNAAKQRSNELALSVIEHFFSNLKDYEGIQLELIDVEIRPGDFPYSKNKSIYYFMDASNPDLTGDSFSLSVDARYILRIPEELSQEYWKTCAAHLVKAVAEVEGTPHFTDLEEANKWLDEAIQLPLEPYQIGKSYSYGYSFMFSYWKSKEQPCLAFYLY